MSSVRLMFLRIRTGWRKRWASLLALALLIGVAGCVALTAIAGAQRTASAPARFMRNDATPDVMISLHELDDSRGTREIAGLPQVLSASIGAGMAALPYTKDGAYLPNVAAVDGELGTTMMRGRLLRGRRLDQNADDEILLSEAHARKLGVQVGDRVPMLAFDKAQTQQCLYSDKAPPACHRLFNTLRLSVRVVGIVRSAADVNSRATDITLSILSRGFFERHRNDLGWTPAVVVRLKPGVSQEQFVAAARRIPQAADAEFDLINASATTDAVNVLTEALWLFALVAGLAGAVAIGQAVVRQVNFGADERSVLSYLGATRSAEIGDAIAPISIAAVAGGALAIIGAVIASRYMPIGFARRIDPNPGMQLTATVVGGAFVIVLATVLGAAGVAYRSTRARHQLRVPGPASRVWTPSAAASPPAFVGFRNASALGRGGDAVPARSAIVGVAAGAAGVIAVLCFSAGLSHLVHTPSLYGWSYDAAGIDVRYKRAVEHDPGIAAVGIARTSIPLRVAGRPTLGMSLEALEGEMSPAIVAGRAPSKRSEIALGADTMSAAHTRIGREVDVVGSVSHARMRVVGQAVFPTGDDAFPLADGAYVAPAAADALGTSDSSENLAVRYQSGVDKGVMYARLDALDAKSGPDNSPPERPTPPGEIEKLRNVESVPKVLAGFLLLLAMIALAHALVVGVRRRSHDYALLRALGFRRRDVRSAVAWEAGTIAAIGALIGVPVGLVLGRLSWARIAGNIGVFDANRVPILVVALAVPAAVAFAIVVAQLPARRAVRLRPAQILRSE